MYPCWAGRLGLEYAVPYLCNPLDPPMVPPLAPSTELKPLRRPPASAAADAKAAKVVEDSTTPLRQPSASRIELQLPGSVVSLYSS